jgi:hypothetical protein
MNLHSNFLFPFWICYFHPKVDLRLTYLKNAGLAWFSCLFGVDFSSICSVFASCTPYYCICDA